MSRSQEYNKTVNAVSADEFPLILIEITHPSLTPTVRIVNDTDDLTFNGNVYTALNFRASLPNQPETGRPVARMEIDNTAKELVDWIELSNGANGAKATMHQVLRSVPNVSEYTTVMYLTNINLTESIVSFDLSYTDIYNKSCLPTVFNRATAKGLF